MILYVMLICQVVSMESIHETCGVNTGHIVLSINSSISYGGFNTKRYNIMFVQCFCLFMGGVERVKVYSYAEV